MRHSLAGMAVAMAVLCASTALAQDKAEPVKIGFMASLSGPLAALGQEQYDGFMLAVNEEGGKLGGIPVEIVKEDDQFKPDVANQAVQRLIDREKISILTGITGTNVMIAIAQQAADKKVLVVSSNAAPSTLAGKDCSPYFFTLSAQDDQKSEVLGQYANDQGYKRAYLMAPNYQAGKGVISGFKSKFTGEILEEIYTPLDQLDFSVELAQLAAAQPDVVYAFYPGSLGINFVRQYHQAGLIGQVPLLSTALVDAIQLPALKQAAVGIKTGIFWADDMQNPQSEAFVTKFKAAYGHVPSEYAAQAYDAARLIAGTLSGLKGDVSDKAKLIETMESAPFESVRGAFRFNTNHFPVHDMHIYEVKPDGEGVGLKLAATPLKGQADSFVAECSMKAP